MLISYGKKKIKYYRLQRIKGIELVNIINIPMYQGKQSITPMDKQIC